MTKIYGWMNNNFLYEVILLKKNINLGKQHVYEISLQNRILSDFQR